MAEAWWCAVCGHWENWHEGAACLLCERVPPRSKGVRHAPHAFVRGERHTVQGLVGRDLEPAARSTTEQGGR